MDLSNSETRNCYRKKIQSCVRTELLARKQCANNPQNPAPGCREYICPLWKYSNGEFDESGFQIDHIVELKFGGSNDISNLQVLCNSCHAIKTRRCARQNWEFTSNQIDFGIAKMDTDRPKKRQRANSI